MKYLTEEQMERRQREAWEKRETILPGDRFWLRCTGADERVCRFAGRATGYELVCEQPMKRIAAGEDVAVYCSQVLLKRNGYGYYVDYRFIAEERTA